MSRLLYQSEQILIEYDREENWIYTDWLGPQDEASIYDGGVHMIEAMRAMASEYECHKVLNDNRRVSGTWGHSVYWAASEWVPAMLAAGLLQFAWVFSVSVFTNLSGLGVRSRADALAEGVFEYFEDIGAAKRWLRTGGKGA